jgi:hypothetical protein
VWYFGYSCIHPVAELQAAERIRLDTEFEARRPGLGTDIGSAEVVGAHQSRHQVVLAAVVQDADLVAHTADIAQLWPADVLGIEGRHSTAVPGPAGIQLECSLERLALCLHIGHADGDHVHA